MKALKTISREVGRGLLAGLAGTIMMTIASTLEMKARGRKPSSAPADAAGKVLGVAPRDDHGKQRFSNFVHFAYGTSWGLARAALGAAGVRGRAAAPLSHLGMVWLTELVMLPALGVAPPVWKWGAKEIAIDALHHGVYVAATDAAYRALGRG
jgi:hypothetical protein